MTDQVEGFHPAPWWWWWWWWRQGKKKHTKKEKAKTEAAVRAAPAIPAELEVSGNPSQLAWGAQAGWGD